MIKVPHSELGYLYYIGVCIVIEVSVSEIKRPRRGLGLGLLRRAA